MNGYKFFFALLVGLVVASSSPLLAYPLDGAESTGIKRLQSSRASQTASGPLPAGALLSLEQVHSSGNAPSELPATDAVMSKRIAEALGEHAGQYGVAVLDISDPSQPVYAGHQDGWQANVGSVGKLLVLLAWMQQLADRFPDDTESRARVLRESVVVADDYVIHDDHAAPVFDPQSGRSVSRPLRAGDQGNLYEVLDWMISASNNAAASLAMRELVVSRHFGNEFPVTPAQSTAYLSSLNANSRGQGLLAAMLGPISRVGLNPERIRQGSLFTRVGKQRMAGTTSYATPRELVRLLSLIESGRFVDPWSSTEAKRLMYLTQRRIRYASHPVLNPAAVYFKSGSLYSCMPEEGFRCRKYMGNKENRLASVAIVEYPADAPVLRYAVAVMSNVLRVNSAVAHQTLALRIHRLIEARHQQRLRDVGITLEQKNLPAPTVEAAEGRD